MPTLPAVIVTLLLPFEHLFDPRTWRKAQLLVVGAILSPGKRTVSSALNILGIGQHGDFAIYHQVLNRARWQPPSARWTRGLDFRAVRRFPAALGEAQQAELRAALPELPASAGIGLANWNWRATATPEHRLLS